jgi:hypothetical protein
MVPTFTRNRSMREAPTFTPTASPRLRRRHSPWPPHRGNSPGFGVDLHPPRAVTGHALQTGPYPPGWSRHAAYGVSNTGFSRTPSRLASRARTVWQYRHVPSLTGLLPTLPGVPRIRLPPASPGCCDSPAVESSHLHSVTRRLVAHGLVHVQMCSLGVAFGDLGV